MGIKMLIVWTILVLGSYLQGAYADIASTTTGSTVTTKTIEADASTGATSKPSTTVTSAVPVTVSNTIPPNTTPKKEMSTSQSSAAESSTEVLTTSPKPSTGSTTSSPPKTESNAEPQTLTPQQVIVLHEKISSTSTPSASTQITSASVSRSVTPDKTLIPHVSKGTDVPSVLSTDSSSTVTLSSTTKLNLATPSSPFAIVTAVVITNATVGADKSTKPASVSQESPTTTASQNPITHSSAGTQPGTPRVTLKTDTSGTSRTTTHVPTTTTTMHTSKPILITFKNITANSSGSMLERMCAMLADIQSEVVFCDMAGYEKNHVYKIRKIELKSPLESDEARPPGTHGNAEKQSEDTQMTLIAILASCGALALILIVFAVYCSYHRLSYRKNQQHLTEELQTVENGYHDNPTLDVMEVQPEVQEKKMALNGEFNDSWIVPFDSLAKDNIPEEEDTHL